MPNTEPVQLTALDLASVTGGFIGTSYDSAGRPRALVAAGDINRLQPLPGGFIQGELFPLASLGVKPR